MLQAVAMQDAGGARHASVPLFNSNGFQQQIATPVLSSSTTPESPPDGGRHLEPHVMALAPASPNAENERPAPSTLQAWRPTVGQGTSGLPCHG
jgi:hypothetical protein